MNLGGYQRVCVFLTRSMCIPYKIIHAVCTVVPPRLFEVTDGRVVRAGVSVTYEVYCQDLEVMNSNPGWVKLEVVVYT